MTPADAATVMHFSSRRSQSEALFYITRSRILFAFKYFRGPRLAIATTTLGLSP
jgi:uncharacterized membrane protein YwaF